MQTTKPDNIALLRDLNHIEDMIPIDLGRGYPLANSFLISRLILEYNLKNYLEIGVHRSRSFFPAAYVTKLLGGMAYGIDPYDLDDGFHREVNAFRAPENLNQIYDELLKLRNELFLSDNSRIIREKSSLAADFFRGNKIAIDMLHIGGNHNAKQVSEDIELYLPFVRSGGFVVMEDINWDSVKPVVNRLKRKFDVVFNNGRIAIFFIGTPERGVSQLQKSKFSILHGMVENLEKSTTLTKVMIPEKTDWPVVSVVVITFNQEKYIAECLEGIFAQKGDFKIELVIGEDCSIDKTLNIIREYVDSLRNHKFEVKILSADKNIGMTENFQRCLAACTGSYIAVCEGDDFWIDCNKLQKQVNFLKIHPECAICFNDCYIYYQERGELTKLDVQQRLESEVSTSREIILTYYIGNLSCCMYDARFMKNIPDSLFDLYIGDWMFNINYSQFGDIGHVKETMSVYRKHAAGVWAGGNPEERDLLLWKLIEDYNKYLSYDFDREFTIVQKRIETAYADKFYEQPLQLAIIDDAFPNPLSAFRIQEFSSYLAEFNDIRIYSSGEANKFLGNEKTLDELITDFKREFPEYASRIRKLETDTRIKAKLFYAVFLGNIYPNIERIEQSRTPFVFTLYPGGSFGLDTAESDRMLQRVTSSPCFRKVIVTQKVTYDYLINKQYCNPDQIEFIFGVVTPLKQIEAEHTGKKHYGIEKNTLDICFVAHKYIKKGVDKGYDVFIDVARQLCRNHDNIYFHVVGGFDEKEIDINDLKGRITFYGKREMEWFETFYMDKDIIISPNIRGKTYPGSFDGFPTGGCVDAGLRKTAIFCTDELGMNANAFSDEDEIVIIPHDAAKITSMVESYYHDPQKLKAIAEKGSLRIKQLYGYEAQILPRITLLMKEIELAERSKKAIHEKINNLADEEHKHIDSASKSIIKDIVFSIKLLANRNPTLVIMHLKTMKDSRAFGRIRGVLAPPHSTREKLIRRLFAISFVRFRNFLRNRKTMRDLALIRSSEFFDKDWYLANNPDVAQANLDPALHYWRNGGIEGRDPSPNFSSQGYLDTYDDVKKAGINPLVHYIKYGIDEGRVTRHQQRELNDTPFRCPVCQEKVEAFAPLSSYYEGNWRKYGFLYNSDDFETLNSSQYFCPKCGATDRDRLSALYLTRMIDQDLSGNPIKILDIAPAYPLKMFLLKYSNIEYQSADKYMKGVDFIVDITNMNSIDQEAYDFFICSHVLEHVIDDHKALSELFRILKPSGSGILMVPINLRIDMILEDPTVADNEERWRRFGQDDHIRLYSKKGFIERVEQAGFTINQYGVDFFGEDAFFQHGISSKSILYIVEKK